VEHPEDVLALVAVLDESTAEIEAQRTMRQKDGTASPSWLQSSAAALKYCGLKLKAAKEHYDRLISGKPPEVFAPVEVWLVTLCNNATGDITTKLSDKHPAEFLLDQMEAAAPEDRDSIVLFNSIKVHPAQVGRANRLFAAIPKL
jgi:hypothetical protein